jgi:hypothetical protein
MRCCGADISGGDLRLAIVDRESAVYAYVTTNPPKISLTNDEDQTLVRSFYDAIETFVRVNDIDLIAIKKRATKGKFAGGSVSFKIEGLLQAIPTCKVALYAPATIAAKHKSEKFEFPAKVFSYQREAFLTACCALASHDG